MFFYPLLALIPFDQNIEISEVRAALEMRIPGYVWELKEVGDGNINYIYIAEATNRKILLKKALDYARINPEAFPLPIERLFFEYKAYTLYQKTCSERIPEIYFYDINRGCLAMEYLVPHIILPKGLIAGNKYPFLAEHLGVFLGKSLYLTSRYALSESKWKENVALFSKNTAMRKIIEDLNFTNPFFGSHLNRWTSPELDDIVPKIQQNSALQDQVNLLKIKFLTDPEALSHGDLHTGSILVTEKDTKVIDTEFATYAPISFDLGMLLANFAMASLSSRAYQLDAVWISSQMRGIWEHFEATFRKLWKYPAISVDDKLSEIWSDTLKLIGVEIIRRTIGLAHAPYFEQIQSRELKAFVERQALEFAQELMLKSERVFPHVESLERKVLILSTASS